MDQGTQASDPGSKAMGLRRAVFCGIQNHIR